MTVHNLGANQLGWIFADMIKAGERNGLVRGFVNDVCDELGNTRHKDAFASRRVTPIVYKTPHPHSHISNDLFDYIVRSI
jgi:hypothetical protein